MDELVREAYLETGVVSGLQRTSAFMDGLITALLDFGHRYGAGHKDAVDFWVAAGTVLSAAATAILAFMTLFSVWFSGRLLRGESQRHQQQFAPILTLTPIINGKHRLVGIDVVNQGLGPALSCGLSFLFRGSAGARSVAIDTTVYNPILVKDDHWPMFFADHSNDFDGCEDFDEAHTFGAVQAHYSDIFGNAYWSNLPRITSSQFPKWVPPECLFGKQKEGVDAVVDFEIRRIAQGNDRARRSKSAALLRQTTEQVQKVRAQVDALKNALKK